MSKVRVVFLGTSPFAVTCLEALIQDEHYEVVGVVTQPDRPAGRKLQLTPTPVKQKAMAQGIRVISPESVNTEMMLEEIKLWSAEIAVVVAFGQILSEKFLSLFRFGAVNVHASLLPDLRGAAPIQRAIERGDQETGVVLQKVVKALDAGDVLGIRKTRIDGEENALQLHDRLAVMATELLHIEMMDYVRGNLAPAPQDHSKATYAKKIDKAETRLDWNKSARELHNKVRAFLMGPGTHFYFQGKIVKVHKTKHVSASGSVPGKVLSVGEDHITVGAGSDSALELYEIQPESRSRMKVSEYLKSHSVTEGDLFE